MVNTSIFSHYFYRKTILGKTVTNGEIIKSYPDDKPYISYLSLGYVNDRPIHVVYAIDENDTCIIITTYEPTSELWEPDYKERKR